MMEVMRKEKKAVYMKVAFSMERRIEKKAVYMKVAFSMERRIEKKAVYMKVALDRLNSLALLSIESQLARALDFKDLIRDFANKKTRQWAFSATQ